MLAKLRQLLSYEFTVAELIGLAIILGTPYLVIGVIWSSTHTDHLQNMHGADLVGVLPRVDRVVAGAAALECVHDVSAGAPPFTTSDTRIQITRRTARWDDREVTVADAMDFWSFAAGAANVVMQLSWPEVGHGVAESTVTSGSLMHHPWKRARTTFSYLAVAILGHPRGPGRLPGRGGRRTPPGAIHPGEPGEVQRLRPRSPDVGRGLPLRRPGGHLPTAAGRTHPGDRRVLLPLRVHPGHHTAGHRGPVARHPRRVRRLLELRVRARR